MSVNNTKEEIKSSISSIYSTLIKRREEEKKAKEEAKRLAKEEKKLEKSEDEEEKPLTRKERREQEIDNWRGIIQGLTGEDLEYTPRRKNKKKYRKWIGDENDLVSALVSKPRKKKKRNYNKEFEPELNMLRSIVSDQNRFTTELQKRYQTAAGPNTKDGNPLNKTLVELAAVINTSRGNSLGVLREIGNLKKTIADLYMKQRKLDADLGGLTQETNDLELIGSNLAAATLFDNPPPVVGAVQPDSTAFQQHVVQNPSISSFDPTSWSGDGIVDNSTKYELVDKKIVVEWWEEDKKARFKAIDSDGNEIKDYPVQPRSIKSVDINNKFAKDEFDQVYPIELM